MFSGIPEFLKQALGVKDENFRKVRPLSDSEMMIYKQVDKLTEEIKEKSGEARALGERLMSEIKLNTRIFDRPVMPLKDDDGNVFVCEYIPDGNK